MKKIFLCCLVFPVLVSCNSSNEKTTASEADTSAAKTSTAPAPDLPYNASYASNFTTDVSDADLKMVLNSYKDWESANLSGLAAVMGDSIYYDAADGSSHHLKKDDLLKMWTTYRDSLSSVAIDMYAWQKMYAPDKKEGHVVTWYKEIDTYKNGKVDSATYHDINQVKDGKIVWYSSMKRRFKK